MKLTTNSQYFEWKFLKPAILIHCWAAPSICNALLIAFALTSHLNFPYILLPNLLAPSWIWHSWLLIWPLWTKTQFCFSNFNLLQASLNMILDGQMAPNHLIPFGLQDIIPLYRQLWACTPSSFWTLQEGSESPHWKWSLWSVRAKFLLQPKLLIVFIFTKV